MRPLNSSGTQCQELQKDIQSIYDWANEVNMTFNGDKFESLRFWPRENKPMFQYISPDSIPIEEKGDLRDLGVQISSDLSFHIHIENLINGTNKLIGMALRTFRGRSRFLMVTIWKTIIQPKLDYCSQLWSPGDQLYITKLENLMRTFP